MNLIKKLFQPKQKSWSFTASGTYLDSQIQFNKDLLEVIKQKNRIEVDKLYPNKIDDSSSPYGVAQTSYLKVTESESNKTYYSMLICFPHQHYYVFEKFEVGQSVFHAQSDYCGYVLPKNYFRGKTNDHKVKIIEPVQDFLFLKLKTDTGYFVIIDNGVITSIEKIK